MARVTLKAALLPIFLSLTSALPAQFQTSSHISSSDLSGGAQSQFVNQDGVTTGQCAYIDQQGRKVKISYTEYPDGRLEAKARESFVTDPKAALRECQGQVKAGQSQLEDQLRQDLIGGLRNAFGGAPAPVDSGAPFFGGDSGAGGSFSSSFDAAVPDHGVFQGSSSFGGFIPDQGQGSFTGSSYFGSNFPTQGPGVFQVSSGDFGAQILLVSQDGVTSGLCSYVDAQGRTVKINYTEHPNGTVTADSQQEFVSDPVAALAPCKQAVRRQQEQHRQQIDQLQKEQQVLQDQLRFQQQNLQDQLRRMQEGFRRQQQQLQQQLSFQHGSIFGSGQFPFNFPNFPFYDGGDFY